MSKRPGENDEQKKVIASKMICVKGKLENVPPGEKSTSEAPIDMLDEYCLTKIFLYLSMEERLNLEEVCMRWLTASELIWHDIKKLEFVVDRHQQFGLWNKPQLKQFYIEKLLTRCGRYLTDLILKLTCDSKVLPIIREHCKNLVNLELSFSKYDESDVDETFSEMHELRSISIAAITNISRNLRDALLHLPNKIEEIHLFYAKPEHDNRGWSSTNILIPVIQKFDSLRSLNLSVFKLNTKVMEAISKKQSLLNLSLEYCEFTNKLCMNMILQLKNLESLDLKHVRTVDNTFLIGLAKSCKNLKRLELSQCGNISDVGLLEIAKLEMLEELMINTITRKSVENVTDVSIGQFRNLKKLGCQGWDYITDMSIKKILENSPELVGLNVTWTSITRETLVHAAEVTKIRNNDLKLRIQLDWNHVDSGDIQTQSPFLIVNDDKVGIFI